MTARIVIAGGGTGGHVFPGLAVANALRSHADVEVVFVGTARGLEKDLVPARGYRLELLDVEPMTGGGLKRAMRGAFVAARATWQARRLARELAPAAVLSVGGYAAGPMALASALSGSPLAILEPNGVLGLANRLLAPLAKRAYVAWPEVAGKLSPRIVRPFGVPLREGFTPSPYRASSRARVLVIGGSLGAKAINDAAPIAFANIASRIAGLEVVHQSGRGNDDALRARYEDIAGKHFSWEVRPFLDDVASELARADVVIARSGAGAVAEIAAVGRAAIFVPFPFAAGDHQRANAESLARAGGAICIVQKEATPDRLASELSALLSSSARREAMALAARNGGRPHAARDVALDLLALARVSVRAPSKKQNGTSSPAPEAH